MSNSTIILKKKYGFEYPFKPDRLARKALTYLKSGKRILMLDAVKVPTVLSMQKMDFMLPQLIATKYI